MNDAFPHNSVAVAVCTYNRNEPLNTLLAAIVANARHLGTKAKVGVVVVDDSPDGNARSIVERFDGRFELGIRYLHSGKRNISVARNLAINTASQIADWTVMTDDDCEPITEWLEALLDVQARTNGDAVTGPMKRRVPPGSPKWLEDEPFLELGLEKSPDCACLSSASTFNSMISSQWLTNNPTLRFQPSLGVIGGEDMVFYRAANSSGLRIYYSERAAVYENEPAERATLAYQLRVHFWHGNSSYVTSVRTGISSFRMFLHAANSLRKAVARPVERLLRGQSLQWRYSLALVLHSLGKMVGVFGFRVSHK
ncbi:glycosyltransferase family 2 protein [Bradyrhizobium genosp. P]|uniref:glycosyltransferase family 2 protein n=1 Tax=Bradyrhizobium genosp. P TaxID=83641 RepID=UPI003CE9176D